MTHTRSILLALAILGLVFSAAAQETSRRPVVTVIDGAVNPHQIPDTTAYRLYFFVLTNEAQETNFGMLKLSAADKDAAIRILNDFKTQDNRLREQHEAQAASGHVNAATFQNERDALIDTTRSNLRETLSVEGMSALDTAIQLNKSHITITQTEAAPVENAASANVSAAPPPIQPYPCPPPTITWTVSAAQTQTRSITVSSDQTTGTVSQNVVYDGTAGANIRWAPDCIPQPYATPYYTPKVYNVQNTVGGWSTGTPVTSGAEFNYGTVSTYIVVLKNSVDQDLVEYNGNYGGELDGYESTYNNETTVIVPWEVIIQFEIAYERTAFTGGRSGCVYSPITGETTCLVTTAPWCNPAGTPPDLNVIAVHAVTSPTPVPPFFENWAPCVRAGSGKTWSCSPAFSLPNFNQAPGLGFCTKTP
jgi:hypothetical protein